MHLLTQLPALEPLAETLNQSGSYRVLRALNTQPERITVSPSADVRLAAVLDVETTGKGDADKIIELALVVFAYNPTTGTVLGVVDVYSGFEDPGFPIPAEAEAVNHITDEQVKGQALDEQQVKSLVDKCDFIIAHKAEFDRSFCERRFPFFEHKEWACSLSEVDWSEEGRPSAKLEVLAVCANFFYDAHRAEADCIALLAVLDAPLKAGTSALKQLLSNKNSPSSIIRALGAPFDAKDKLKARGYSWNDGTKPGSEKAWFRKVKEEDVLPETLWLKEEIFRGQSRYVLIEEQTAMTRFSPRSNKMRVAL